MLMVIVIVNNIVTLLCVSIMTNIITLETLYLYHLNYFDFLSCIICKIWLETYQFYFMWVNFSF